MIVCCKSKRNLSNTLTGVVIIGKINSTVIMGRITHDPELRYTANNTPVCSFQLAIPRPTSDGATIPCVAWREKAQFISQWFAKGMLMIVIGQLTSRTWQDGINAILPKIHYLQLQPCKEAIFSQVYSVFTPIHKTSTP